MRLARAQTDMSEPQKSHRTGARTALDIAPLIVFFGVYFALGNKSSHLGLMWATGAFMAATILSLAVTYVLERRVHPMPLITAGVVLVFGGLTIYLNDERFIKLKPTIVYTIFAAVLLGGLALRKLLIRHLFGSVFHLTDEGWRVLTIRWGLFFVFAAILNELVWRNFSTDFWITFKVWGFMSLTFVFAIWQAMFVTRYQVKPEQHRDPIQK
jgi:intracellular septation protein